MAKRDLKKGEILDGEGGHMVWGKQIPANRSLTLGGLPLGLASHAALTKDVRAGNFLSWEDAAIDTKDQAVIIRREMEAAFGQATAAE